MLFAGSEKSTSLKTWTTPRSPRYPTDREQALRRGASCAWGCLRLRRAGGWRRRVQIASPPAFPLKCLVMASAIRFMEMASSAMATAGTRTDHG